MTMQENFIKECKESGKLPIIELFNNDLNEYEFFEISFLSDSIKADSNLEFKNISVSYDEGLSLDEHLSLILDKILLSNSYDLD